MGKGSDRERQAVDIYQRAGYATYRPATVQYGENDVFGLFDLLAVSPDGGAVHAVQIKSRSAGVADYGRRTHLFRRLGFRPLWLVYHNREGWTLLDPHSDPSDARRSAAVAYDERDDPKVGPTVATPLNLGDGLVRYLLEGDDER